MYMSRGRPSLSGAGHPFARVFGHGAGARATRGVNQIRGPAVFSGARQSPGRARVASKISRRRPLVGQGPDVPIAQPVVACGPGDLGDVLAAAGLDAFAVEPSSITVGAFGGDCTCPAGVSVCSVTNSPFVSRWSAVASPPDHRAGDPCMLHKD